MENGYVYDAPLSGALERELHDGDYHLIYSHAFAHVALYRIHTVDTADQLPDDARSLAASSAPSRTHKSQRTPWFEPASITAVKQQRGLGL